LVASLQWHTTKAVQGMATAMMAMMAMMTMMAMVTELPPVESFVPPHSLLQPCSFASSRVVKHALARLPAGEGWQPATRGFGASSSITSGGLGSAVWERSTLLALRAKKRGGRGGSRPTGQRRTRDEDEDEDEDIETYATCPMCSSDIFRKLEPPELAVDVRVQCENCGNTFKVSPENWKNISDIYKVRQEDRQFTRLISTVCF